jgi:hypothetical protein
MKAFPSTEPIYRNDIVGVKESSGMDLRDYFASHAMQGYCSNSEHIRNCTIQMTAESAYEVADAMMEARNDNK